MAYLLAGSVALSLSGCALLDKSKTYVDKSKEYMGKSVQSVKSLVAGSDKSDKTEKAADEKAKTSASDGDTVLAPPKKNAVKDKSQQTQTTGKAVKNKKKKGKGKNQSVSQEELAGARRDVAELEQTVVDADKDVAVKPADVPVAVGTDVPADFSVNGEWTIYSVRDNVVTGEERPYITFDLAARKFYGTNGCNIINGDLNLGEGTSISLDNIVATMKMCADAPFEYLINLAVSEVRSYGVRQEGSVTFLDLRDAEGKIVLVLRRHNMDFLNGAWKITDLNGEPLVPVEGEEQPTMTINIPDLKIHGTTGCNIFNGALFIDPDKTDSMQFIDIATTRRGCPPNAHETDLLLALEEVETARPLSDTSIAMYDVDGKELFKMQKIEY